MSERWITDGTPLKTISDKELPLRVIHQNEYNRLWNSLPYLQQSEQKNHRAPLLQANGYAHIVTEDFIATVGIGELGKLPICNEVVLDEGRVK